MQVVRDLAGGPKPGTLSLFYNGDYDADSVTKRYKGSLVKVMDWNTAAGIQLSWAGTTVAMENIFGILEEEQGITGNYQMNDTTYGARMRKVTPILPSTIVRAEYARKDPSGTVISESTSTGSKAGTTITGTTTDIDVNDLMIGGWVYFLDGANDGYLHYITDSTNAGETMTIATALNGALVATDTFLCIAPPMTYWLCPDAHYVNLLSTMDDGARTLPVMGLMTYIDAVGMPFQPLMRNTHDGLKIKNARFYHEFLIGGSATLGNVFRDTIVRA